MTDDEIAFRAAINLLRDSLETRRMPSGLRLEPLGVALHERAANHLEALLDRKHREPTPDRYLLWSHKNGTWWAPLGFGYTGHLSEAGRHTRLVALTSATAAIPGTSSRLSALPVLPVRLDDIETMVAAFREEYPGEPETWE